MSNQDSSERRNYLSRQIYSVAQVRKMSDQELDEFLAEHDKEIIRITGVIDAHPDAIWVGSTKRASRVLKAHREWLRNEIADRKKKEKAAKHAQLLACAEAARKKKLEAIENIPAKSIEDITMFKIVAREVLGDEMYTHLWCLTQERLAAKKAP